MSRRLFDATSALSQLMFGTLLALFACLMDKPTMGDWAWALSVTALASFILFIGVTGVIIVYYEFKGGVIDV